MKLHQLRDKSIIVLGLGMEGRGAVKFLRREFPQAILAVADQQDFERLSGEARSMLAEDPLIHRHLGPHYLSFLHRYDVIVKSPGIPVVLPQYQEAVRSGKAITSPTAIFFANFPG